jgi:hypothetical protein
VSAPTELSSQSAPAVTEFASKSTVRTALVASLVGTTIEWYDYFLYATAARLLVFILVVAVGTAVWDAVFGSWGNAIVSAVYLAALGVELFSSRRRQAQLLANADEAAALARTDD